jgi:HAT1-interacting factor 1
LSPQTKHIIERLADTHDWQAEISLENESFQEAAEESRTMLKLRQQIYPEESELVAEGHYKLALALEFAFFTAVREAKEAESEGKKDAAQLKDNVDPKMLYEAVEELALAIQSCEARVSLKEKSLAALTGDEATKLEKEIKDIKEIVQDMMPKVCMTLDTPLRPQKHPPFTYSSTLTTLKI